MSNSLADLYRAAKQNPEVAATWLPPDNWKGVVKIVSISKFNENACFVTYEVVQDSNGNAGRMFQEYLGYQPDHDFTIISFFDKWGLIGFPDSAVLKLWDKDPETFKAQVMAMVNGRTFVVAVVHSDKKRSNGNPYYNVVMQPRKGKAAKAANAAKAVKQPPVSDPDPVPPPVVEDDLEDPKFMTEEDIPVQSGVEEFTESDFFDE